jgi:glycopeptide antibiotics resistance protein
MLRAAWREFEASRFYIVDLLMNVAGFVPLGFIFGAYFLLGRSRRQAILYATLVGGVLSFAVEVLQAYIPQRVSGTTDIITNTLGTFLGALLARPNMVRAIVEKVKLSAPDRDSASQQY